jgi:hypothetical protein
MSGNHFQKQWPEAAAISLLAHVARYRLTVFSALKGLPELSNLSPGQVSSALRACQRERLIDSAPLHQGARYWFLTRNGAPAAGISEEHSGPLSEPAKLRAFAMLHFCCLANTSRYRLTAADIKRGFPALYRPGMPNGYYFDPADDGRIGLLRIDAAGPGRWDRVLQSLRNDIGLHWIHPEFRQLADARRFQITLLTVLPQKASRLRQAIAELRDARRVPVEVAAMPELLPLVMPWRRKEASPRQSR